MNRSRTLLGLLSGALLAAGCSDVTAPPPPPTPPEPLPLPAPMVSSVSPDTLSGGAVVLDMVVTGSDSVRVVYSDDNGHSYRVHSPRPAAGEMVLLPEVVGGEHYRYEVSALTRSGVSSPVVTGEFTAPPPPADLALLHVTTIGTSTRPLTMLQSFNDFKGFVVVNGRGEKVWWWRTQGSPQGFARRRNGNFVFDDAGFGLYEVTPGREVVHSLPREVGGNTHHDVLVTPTNTVLYLSSETRAVGDSTLTGDTIYEWNPETGEVTRRWSVFDALDPRVDIGPHSNRNDWTHANSIAWGNHGNLIVSLNWLDQVVSIAPDYQSLEWRLGGVHSSFTLGAGDSFAGQHTAQMLANGHILMFDNGRDRPDPAHYSRALELSLDPATHTARTVWSYRTTPDDYSPYMGSARRLGNGHTFVFFALPRGSYGGSGPQRGLEVRADGTVAFQLDIANAGESAPVYRGEPLAAIASSEQSILVTRIPEASVH